mmetsp:Transcript_7302/g.12254  ORF Transcript_7302/g.12254 Transcript_7302/m.12254 type:complete len:246 (+) Transcript_7302:182-919(+)
MPASVTALFIFLLQNRNHPLCQKASSPRRLHHALGPEAPRQPQPAELLAQGPQTSHQWPHVQGEGHHPQPGPRASYLHVLLVQDCTREKLAHVLHDALDICERRLQLLWTRALDTPHGHSRPAEHRIAPQHRAPVAVSSDGDLLDGVESRIAGQVGGRLIVVLIQFLPAHCTLSHVESVLQSPSAVPVTSTNTGLVPLVQLTGPREHDHGALDGVDGHPQAQGTEQRCTAHARRHHYLPRQKSSP